MNVSVAYPEGVPVLTLVGSFNGPGAVTFDAASDLDVPSAHWVLEFSGVTYLSSVGLRSLVSLKKRLSGRNGSLVLAGTTPLVRQVLQVSGLEALLRFTPTLAEALALVPRGSSSSSPTISCTVAGCLARLRRLPESASVLESWAPISKPGAGDSPLVSVGLSDLGFAFGTGLLGEPGDDALGAIGTFVSTPWCAGALGAQAGGVSDFIVGEASTIVPMQVALALGLSGTPAAVVELESETPFELLDALDGLFDVVSEHGRPSVLGYVALAQSTADRRGVLATAVAFDRSATGAMDPDGLLAGWPGQAALASGRTAIGGAVVLDSGHDLPPSTDLRDAVRSYATLDALRDVIGVGDCGRVTRVVAWVFTPTTIRTGADKLLQVTVDGTSEWRPEWDAIIRRLYHDCRSVTLTPLHGGFMSKTFRAVAYDHDGRRTLPTVVKLGPTALTAREQKANRDYVSRFILNNGTTVLGDAQQGDWAGLRYNFLGVNGPESRLSWLVDHYEQRPEVEVLSLFERLFTRVLKPWYAQPRWEQVSLYEDHTPLRLFPGLIEIAERELGVSADAPTFDCPELGVELPNPFHFLKYEYPERAKQTRLWYTTICHGDLNLRNVLVDERDNLYVIDFSETRPRNAVSDFARIEPILKFEMTRIESDEDLRLLVEFEEGLTSVTRLDERPPFRYRGDDPMVARASAGINLLRRFADRGTLFEQDMVPYWLALLEWTYSVVCYTQLSLRRKRYAACSAALICRSIRQIESAE